MQGVYYKNNQALRKTLFNSDFCMVHNELFFTISFWYLKIIVLVIMHFVILSNSKFYETVNGVVRFAYCNSPDKPLVSTALRQIITI